jgi:hypothetical protein
MAPRKKDGAGDLVKARLEGWAGFHPSSRPKIERHSLMNRSAAVGGNIRSVSKHESVETIEPALARPTVLVASAEPVIGASMRDLLYGYPLKTVWARGVEEVRFLANRRDLPRNRSPFKAAAGRNSRDHCVRSIVSAGI